MKPPSRQRVVLARKLVSYIGSEPALKPLLARLKDLACLEQIYAEAVPVSLARLSRLGYIEDGTVTIFAANGAAAAKLKQLVPRMKQQFSYRNREVTQIRITVQVAETGTFSDAARSQRRCLPQTALQDLAALVERLPPSPLRDAVTRLLSRRQ